MARATSRVFSFGNEPSRVKAKARLVYVRNGPSYEPSLFFWERAESKPKLGLVYVRDSPSHKPSLFLWERAESKPKLGLVYVRDSPSYEPSQSQSSAYVRNSPSYKPSRFFWERAEPYDFTSQAESKPKLGRARAIPTSRTVIFLFKVIKIQLKYVLFAVLITNTSHDKL